MILVYKLSRSSYFWLGLILILALLARTYALGRPIADWHSWRQADTAAVARNFVKEGFHLLTPRYDDLSPVSEDSLPNPEGYRYVEFPLYSALVGLVWLIYPFQEWAARMVSIILSLGSIVLLFLIVRRFLDLTTALVVTFIFAFLPYNIFYSTVILPEPLLVFAILASLLFASLWFGGSVELWQEWLWGSLAIGFWAVALLTKPVAVFLLLPIAYLAYYYLGAAFYRSIKFWLLVSLPILPFLAWRLIAITHPEGIPRFWWLLNGDQIRFTGAFFYWLIQDRLNRLMLSTTGFALLVMGLLFFSQGERLFFLSWLVSMIAYLVVFATGNVTHDYYQVPLVPILAVFVGKGFRYLINLGQTFISRSFYIALAFGLLVLMFGLTWREVRGLFQINNPRIVEVGRLADKMLPKDAKVIAPYGGDTAFLYQTNRKGWAIAYLPIEEMIDLGAQYYVTVNMDSQARDLMAAYRLLAGGDDFAIIDLTQPVNSR